MLGNRAFSLMILTWITQVASRWLGRLRIGNKTLDSSDYGRIATNVMIGGVAMICIHFASDLPMIKQNSEGAMDSMIRMNAGSNPSNTARLRPFVFLDIDEETYRAWNEPLYVPRAKLLQLIRAAVDGKAAVVLVDVELSKQMEQADDRALVTYLASLDKPAEAGSQTTILLARGVRTASNGRAYPEERLSFLDTVVAQATSVRWGAPVYSLEKDGLLRRWRPWETVCERDTANAQPRAIPSIQLQALAALDPHPAAARDRIQKTLLEVTPKSCDKNSNSSRTGSLHLAGMSLKLNKDELGQRILFAFPWKLKEGEARQAIRWGAQAEYPLLTVKPAFLITEGPAVQPATDWRGQIVVIGASFADSRDLFMTPVGEMPGALLLINTLQSLLQYGETHTPPLWLMLMVEVMIILVLSIVFVYVSSFWGVVLSGAFVIFIMFPLSFFFFQDGIWLNFALPVVFVQMLELGNNFKKMKTKIPPSGPHE